MAVSCPLLNLLYLVPKIHQFFLSTEMIMRRCSFMRDMCSITVRENYGMKEDVKGKARAGVIGRSTIYLYLFLVLKLNHMRTFKELVLQYRYYLIDNSILLEKRHEEASFWFSATPSPLPSICLCRRSGLAAFRDQNLTSSLRC